jgi:DNA-binding LacI/PurR family transcriptional regulator
MSFPEGKPGSLRIGLWSDLADMPATHHRILAGASQRASEQNQYLSVHSIVRSRGVPLSPEELGRQLRSHPSDVYIVAERWAEQFNEAFAGAMPRTMFFNSSRPLHRYEPVVGLDNEGIVEAGVKQLHSAGSQNIAILALDVPDRPLWEELEAYRRTLRREGLDCQNIQTCTLGRDSARQASLALLAGPDRPEAVYVADDHLLEGFVDAVEETGLQIGRDLAVVTLSNAGVPLPPRCNWSRVEFDLVALGELLIDTAERLVRQGPERTSSCLLRHKWIPGVTHWK